MRRAATLVIVAVLTAACSDALSGVGDVSRDFVHGDESSTTTIEEAGPGLGLKGITDVVWINDDLDVTAEASGDLLIRAVWDRSDRLNPFVQAGRREVAAALGGVKVPKLVPEGVRYVSSQLVYDPETALLDASTSAAFGYWSAEPYSVPRSEGQLMVLRIGLATTEEVAGFSEIAQFNVEGGRELAWVEGDYVYQLFCRTGVIEEACLAIADSATALALLLPFESDV